MKWFSAIVFSFVLAASLHAGEPVDEEGRTRFCAVDIVADSGSTPLAAYQVEIVLTNMPARIVGIEGGEHPAFSSPPAYDPAAIQQERVILAAFSTRAPSDLPAGQTRVATLHFEVQGDQDPQCLVRVQAAGDAAGNRIPLTVTCKQRTP